MNYNKLKTLIIYVFLFTPFAVIAFQAPCVIGLKSKNNPKVKSSISGIDSYETNAQSLLTSNGIILNCQFTFNEIPLGRAFIQSFNYSIIRKGKIYKKGKNDNPFWGKELKECFNHLQKDDSIVFNNFHASIRTKDSIIDLNKYEEVDFEDIHIHIITTSPVVTKQEAMFNKKLLKNSTFQKLVDDYGSDKYIGNSLVTFKFEYSNDKATMKKRYQFISGENVDLDYTFFGNKKGEIIKVYDNIKAKSYELTEWEKIK